MYKKDSILTRHPEFISGSKKQKNPVSVETLSTHFFLFGSNAARKKKETGGAQRKKNVGFLPPVKSLICSLASLCSRSQRRVSAFTLAEVLITLAIIGVVAALTIPVVVKNYQETAAVSRVKKHYRNIADIVQQWQVEEGCSDNVSGCIEKYNGYNCKNIFSGGLEKKIKILKIRYQNQDYTDIDWLPDSNTLFNAAAQFASWQGVSKISAYSNITCHYLLSDGTTMMIHMPDTYNRSGFMFIDINGKKAPNRVGKDIFPISIGAYNNPKYTTVNPYYAEDSSATSGLCLTRNNGVCDPDVCTQTSCSPTAYVLKNGKLPPVTW